ncbi:hypothetical protein FNF27_03326 [Cafeteria roenbergensis]|uniref:Glycosyl transferase family 1 domain-containing protein n=1 Tax=Cafeteria roenbergensis TaxID=33653 RepID=A0A5A8C1J0_CAFRO|nr:hypothetical protein FNF29_07938 [Cafeteria roenbergensis]KAA0175318.1 hypothetical protein FNF27_03326 [Cafeteria roenbergensis]|eukprot:KAA0146605.1 hypothetical protein FNF29_07938 [Cafeteria roenbergensis]
MRGRLLAAALVLPLLGALVFTLRTAKPAPRLAASSLAAQPSASSTPVVEPLIETVHEDAILGPLPVDQHDREIAPIQPAPTPEAQHEPEVASPPRPACPGVAPPGAGRLPAEVIANAVASATDADWAIPSLHTMRTLHPTEVVDLSRLSGAHETAFATSKVAPEAVPFVRCGDHYDQSQHFRILAECLPFAPRGALVMVLQDESSEETCHDDVALATALGRAGFLVLVRAHAPWACSPKESWTGHYIRLAPSTFLQVQEARLRSMQGVFSEDELLPAPHLLMGDLTSLPGKPDTDALRSSGAHVVVVARRGLRWSHEAARAGAAEHGFLLWAACRASVSAVLVRGKASAADMQATSCGSKVRLMSPDLPRPRGADAIPIHDVEAARITALLGDLPQLSGWTDPRSEPGAETGGAPPPKCDEDGQGGGSHTVSWDMMLFQRPQHMARAMANRNALVLYVGIARVLGLLREAPGAPGVFLGDERIGMWMLKGGAVISLYSTWAMQGVEAAKTLESVGNVAVYEYIDAIDPEISADLAPQLLQLRDASFACASVLAVTARELLDHVGPVRPGVQVKLVPNGVYLPMYEFQADDAVPDAIRDFVASDKPIVGYFGAIAPWIWLELITSVAKLLPEVNFVIIGPAYHPLHLPDASELPSNLRFLGGVPAADLVLYARHWSAGIIPFRHGDIARTTSPLKLFEYFALGLPVVATDSMVECTRFDVVHGASTEAEFASAIEAAIGESKDEDFRNHVLALAEENSWDRRADDMIEAIMAAASFRNSAQPR